MHRSKLLETGYPPPPPPPPPPISSRFTPLVDSTLSVSESSTRRHLSWKVGQLLSCISANTIRISVWPIMKNRVVHIKGSWLSGFSTSMHGKPCSHCNVQCQSWAPRLLVPWLAIATICAIPVSPSLLLEFGKLLPFSCRDDH